MTGRTWTIIVLVVITALVFSSGCRSASSPASSFYTLTPVTPAPEAESSPPGSSAENSIGIGPVTLAQMLNRAQILTRTAPNRVQYNEFHRWAGSLEDNILHVLTENMSSALAPRPVRAFPWGPYAPPAIRVAIRVQRFEGNLKDTALLDVYWTVTDAVADKELLSKRSVITEPVESADYDGLVAAQSRAIGTLSEEMADALDSLLVTGNP